MIIMGLISKIKQYRYLYPKHEKEMGWWKKRAMINSFKHDLTIKNHEEVQNGDYIINFIKAGWGVVSLEKIIILSTVFRKFYQNYWKDIKELHKFMEEAKVLRRRAF